MTNRYSVNAMYSLAAEQDVDIEDDLARAQKRLRELKARISAQSKKNFVLERDVRYLDSRIALLIQNKMAAEEKRQVAETLEEVDGEDEGVWLDEKRQGQYANLFFLLQSEPRHVASLCRLVSLAEIDTLLQSVMFTLFGNQYEQREEHLLLTMFQVGATLAMEVGRGKRLEEDREYAARSGTGPGSRTFRWRLMTVGSGAGRASRNGMSPFHIFLF
jgi:Ras GTPase-activating-like protein IQGAP2/3